MSGGLASCGWLGTSFDTCRGPLMGAGVGCKPHSPDVLPHLAPSSHQASSPHSSTEHQTTLQGCPSHLLSACASTERCRDAQRAGTASPPDASTADTLTPVGSSAASLEAELAMQHAASLHESSGPRGSAAAGGLHTGNSNNSRNGSAGGAIQPGWGVGTLGAQLMGQQQPGLAPLFGVPTPNTSSGMPAASQRQQEGAEAGRGMQVAAGQWQPCGSPLETPAQQQPQPVQAGGSLYDMDMSSWFEEPAPSPNVQQQQQQDQSHLLAQQQQQQQAQGHLSPQQQQQQQQSMPMSQPWGAGASTSWPGAGATTPACMPMVSVGMPISSPTPAAAGAYGGTGAATQQHHSMASPQQPPMGSAPPMSSNMAGAGQQYAGGDGDSSYQEWLHSIAASHPLLARVGDTPAAGTLSPPTSSGMAGGGSPGAGSGSSGSPGAPGGLVGPLVGLLTGQGRQLPPLQLAAAERALHQHLEKAYQAGYLDGYSHGQAAGRATAAAAAAAAAAGGGYMPPRPLSGGGAPPTLPGSYRAPPVAWPPPGCHPPRHPAAPGYPPAFGASGAGSHPLGKRGAPHLELPRKRPVPNKLSSPTGGSNTHGGQRQVPPRGAPHPSALPPPSGELSPQGSGGLQMYPPLASALPPPAFGAGPAHLSGGARRHMPGNARPQRSGPQRPPAPAPTAGASQVEQLREVATAAAKAALQTPPAATSSLDREAAAACLSTLSTEELVAMASRVAAAATAGVLPVVPELTALSQGLGCSSK